MQRHGRGVVTKRRTKKLVEPGLTKQVIDSTQFLFSARNVHIVLCVDGWGIFREGRDFPSRVLASRAAAVKEGARIAKSERIEQVIHSKDGRVFRRFDYSHPT